MITRISPLILLALLLVSCFSAHSIRGDGLKHVRLGGEMPDVDRLAFHGRPLYDTLYDEGGFQWRTVIIEYPQGKVYVEEDFFGRETVNRIRIETPDLAVKKQIRVGNTLSDLQELGLRWVVTPIPAYGRIDVSSGSLHFLVSDAGIDADALQDRVPAFESLPPEARILAIVVM